MARMNSQALKQVTIDGEAVQVPSHARITDVVPRDVSAVTVVDEHSGKTRTVSRADFDMAVPEGFTTHLTPIAKG